MRKSRTLMAAMAAAMTMAVSARAQPQRIIHRTFTGILSDYTDCSGELITGGLTAHAPSCTYTVAPSVTSPNSSCGDNQYGPHGGFLVEGSGDCPGEFEIVFTSISNQPFPVTLSDFGKFDVYQTGTPSLVTTGS